MDSRDFVNLRCWQVIKNGNIIEDVDTVNEDSSTLTKESLQQSQQNIHEIKRATSEINLSDNQISGSVLDKSVFSLSKSLGAKVFSDDEFQSAHPDMFSSRSTTDDADEFVDANETQGAQSTNESTHLSEEAENIKDIACDLCDKMYIVSGVSIKYEMMPNVSKYTRYESQQIALFYIFWVSNGFFSNKFFVFSGDNLLACWAMRESKSDPNICTFEWLMCLDLKGRFPRFVLDKVSILR